MHVSCISVYAQLGLLSTVLMNVRISTDAWTIKKLHDSCYYARCKCHYSSSSHFSDRRISGASGNIFFFLSFLDGPGMPDPDDPRLSSPWRCGTLLSGYYPCNMNRLKTHRWEEKKGWSTAWILKDTSCVLKTARSCQIVMTRFPVRNNDTTTSASVGISSFRSTRNESTNSPEALRVVS